MNKLAILLLLLPTLIKDCIAGLGISFLSLEAAVEAGQLSWVLRLQFFVCVVDLQRNVSPLV